jgi:tetratricopeptide (TPR) repeat protein
VLYKLKAYEEVIEVCEKAEIWRIKSVPRFLLASALYKVGKLKKAHTVLVWEINEKRKKSKEWLLMGKILEKCGYWFEAQECFEKAIYYEETCEGAKKHLAMLKKYTLENPMTTNQLSKVLLDEPLIPLKEDTKGRACDNFICILL